MIKPATSMRLKRLRHHFGVLAPRVVVRPLFSARLLYVLLVLQLLMIVAVVWYLRSGEHVEGAEFSELRQLMLVQQQELEALRQTVGTGQSAISMERAAQQQLLTKLQELEAENAALKEDLAIFERLVPVASGASTVRIENFRVQADGGPAYRYRLMLAYVAAQRGQVFRGAYQLRISYQQAGKVQEKLLPGAAGTPLEIRHLLRRDGVFDLPPESRLLAVEVHVLQDGKLVARQEARF